MTTDIQSQLSADIHAVNDQINVLSLKTVNHSSELISLEHNIDGLEEQLFRLTESVSNLKYKFDFWQENVDQLLANAQGAMIYDNYILTALAVFLAVAGILFHRWASKSNAEAVAEVDRKIAKGILSENSDVRSKMIQTIINSEEFKGAVRSSVGFASDSEDADQDRFPEKDFDGENINASDLKKAKDENCEEETSKSSKKSDKMNGKKRDAGGS